MRKQLFTYILFLSICFLSSCFPKATSVIIGSDYDSKNDQTDYFVIPYGSVSLPGKWEKTNYNSVSRQQDFMNKDSVRIAIAFTPYNKYEFNMDGSKKGFEFVKAYYEWESKYFVDSHKLNSILIEENDSSDYVIFRIYGLIDQGDFDTYFLFNEKNGNVSNYSVTKKGSWTEENTIEFLKNIFLAD
jgi:hypothetical protein